MRRDLCVTAPSQASETFIVLLSASRPRASLTSTRSRASLDALTQGDQDRAGAPA
jgi:hypothetical protein